MIRAAIISVVVGVITIFVLMYIRQCLLRILLSYRGWMYSEMRNPPKKILLWALLVRLISGYQPSLYSFQRSLPRMPVPSLKETLQKLIVSLDPYKSEEELALLRKQAKEFEYGIGPKLQKILILKSWITQNYVSDWWEKYVYLRSRSPLPINCNYYILDQSYWKATSYPVSRAAALLHNILKFKKLVDREELPPLLLRNTIPICMAQYERLFSTTRIPGEEIDQLIHYDTSESKHIIVVSMGYYYKLDVYDARNQYLSMKTLESQIQWIVDDSNSRPELSVEERDISALTTIDRTEWWRIRREYMFSGLNDRTRELIESSICCLWLMDEKPDDLCERARFLLHGNHASAPLWFDKCFNLVVFANGRCGINCEHSLADAPAYGHMWEFALCKDILESTFDENGKVFPPNKTFKQAPVYRPLRLSWDLDMGELRTEVRSARNKLNDCIDDLDLVVMDHSAWGKGEMKKSRISPDAFVQAALQMAYYKENGHFVQTYEASMTRLYLNGRTETVRSCTSELVAFVKSMCDSKKSNEQRINLLTTAAAKHTNLYKDAMNGRGIDRHLFALYVACNALGHESEFLRTVLTHPWTLSSSQTPHTQQTAVPDPNWQSFSDKLCPGGGFGPVSHEGYGVSYMFPNDHRIFFHISSKRSAPGTDSARFGRYINQSLDEIRALFE